MAAAARRLALTAPTNPTVTAARTFRTATPAMTFNVCKHDREWVEEHPNVRGVLDEYHVPGKFKDYFIPTKRQLKREKRLKDPPPPPPDLALIAPTMAANSRRNDTPQFSKKLAQRVSRAIHDILYDPASGLAMASTDDPADSSWRVDRVTVAGTGNVTIWWVPNEDLDTAVLLDNDFMVTQLETTAKSVKAALRHKLRLRKNEMPKITFMRRDTSLDLLMDIVENERVMAEAFEAFQAQQSGIGESDAVESTEGEGPARAGRRKRAVEPQIDLLA
ncbi:hypothetical protein GGF31_001783 [Allomyces arbusculus]|nr:hypothetical protein GGF31_001783 [Allomyces arbusculus]